MKKILLILSLLLTITILVSCKSKVDYNFTDVSKVETIYYEKKVNNDQTYETIEIVEASDILNSDYSFIRNLIKDLKVIKDYEVTDLTGYYDIRLSNPSANDLVVRIGKNEKINLAYFLFFDDNNLLTKSYKTELKDDVIDFINEHISKRGVRPYLKFDFDYTKAAKIVITHYQKLSDNQSESRYDKLVLTLEQNDIKKYTFFQEMIDGSRLDRSNMIITGDLVGYYNVDFYEKNIHLYTISFKIESDKLNIKMYKIKDGIKENETYLASYNINDSVNGFIKLVLNEGTLIQE